MVKTDSISIVDYNSSYDSAFKSINEHWIKDGFEMEEADELVLNNPERYILKNDGCILIALFNGEVAGTCALINEGQHIYELTKMAVSPQYRGLKIGFHLGVAIIDKARSLKANKIILFSNRGYSRNAIQLYKKLGFIEIPLGNAPWERADIKMEFNISGK